MPKASEVCLKPADQSGITFRLLPPQSDGSSEAKPGWVIARPAVQVMGYVALPKAVDLPSVKLSIDPAADWTFQPYSMRGATDKMVPFNFLPAGGNKDEPRNMQWGKPGWITLSVDAAKGQDGSDLITSPVKLKIFAFSSEMRTQYPYLDRCYGSLNAPPG